MPFDVAAGAYNRFMGRFSEPLAAEFLATVPLSPGQQALDVGCGPGALTAQLVGSLGVDKVSAVDPSSSFVEAARARFDGLDVRRASAEQLPYDDDAFDASFAQLVVHFMADPVAGLREMGRVTRAGGTVAACVWDYVEGGAPLTVFWDSAQRLDHAVAGESGLAGARPGQLSELCERAGLHGVRETSIGVTVPFDHFEAWWQPFTEGVGPAGTYVASLDDVGRSRLREVCAEALGPPPFAVEARAWSVTAHAG